MPLTTVICLYYQYFSCLVASDLISFNRLYRNRMQSERSAYSPLFGKSWKEKAPERQRKFLTVLSVGEKSYLNPASSSALIHQMKLASLQNLIREQNNSMNEVQILRIHLRNFFSNAKSYLSLALPQFR